MVEKIPKLRISYHSAFNVGQRDQKTQRSEENLIDMKDNMKPYYDDEKDVELQFSPDGASDPWGWDVSRRSSSASNQGSSGLSRFASLKYPLGFLLIVGMLVLLFKPGSFPELVKKTMNVYCNNL